MTDKQKSTVLEAVFFFSGFLAVWLDRIGCEVFGMGQDDSDLRASARNSVRGRADDNDTILTELFVVSG